jgi:hypothetical protein
MKNTELIMNFEFLILLFVFFQLCLAVGQDLQELGVTFAVLLLDAVVLGLGGVELLVQVGDPCVFFGEGLFKLDIFIADDLGATDEIGGRLGGLGAAAGEKAKGKR